MTTHATVQIIRGEHAALSAVLQLILLHVAQARKDSALPDFAALRAMLFYIDEFPEKRHHHKETELLFPKLRARTPMSRELLDHLDAEHAFGERNIRELEHALLAFEMMGESRRELFEKATERYVNFYQGHMALEEREILPLAEKVLTAADWNELDDAFMGNRDPLTGHTPETDYETLFRRIACMLPASAILGHGAFPTLARAS